MAQTTQLTENQTVTNGAVTKNGESVTADVKPTRRPVPAPGRVVGFEEALQITLKEDKELLHRLAQ